MSPATRAVTSGNSHTDANSSSTSGMASPDSRTYLPNATSLGEPLWSASAVTKMIGTAIAAPRPRYVRFCDHSLRSSHRYAVRKVGIRRPAPAGAPARTGRPRRTRSGRRTPARASPAAAPARAPRSPALPSAIMNCSTTGSSALKRSSPSGDGDVAERELLGDPARALDVRGPQPVPAPHRALQVDDRPLVQDPAPVDDRDPVAQLLDVGHLVAREHHRDPLRREPAHERLHVAHPGRVEPGGGLVEQEQLRPAQQRGGDAEPLLHAVGVVARPGRRPARPGRRWRASRRPASGRRRRRRRRTARGSCARSGRGRTAAPRRTRPRPGARAGRAAPGRARTGGPCPRWGGSARAACAGTWSCRRRSAPGTRTRRRARP